MHIAKDEAEQIALRMGLDKALRDFPEAVHGAASRLTEYAAVLPAGWTATTEPS